MIIKYEPSEIYRGVTIHSFQTRERIESRVKPEIDRVMGMNDIDQLFRYCRDLTCPPEARLLAAAMLEAIFNLAVEERRERPDIDLSLVRAHVAGLDEGNAFRSPWRYGSIAEPSAPGAPRSEMRPEPLTDEQLHGRQR